MAYAEEISIWPTRSEVNKIKNLNSDELEKQGYYEHPCGYVKIISTTIIPPPDSDNYIEGTEKVFEFDLEGVVLNQWAMPVDSYLYAVSGKSIIVREGEGALKISREGSIARSNVKAIIPKVVECPTAIKKMYGNSDYVRCTMHVDINSKKSRYFVYESVCT